LARIIRNLAKGGVSKKGTSRSPMGSRDIGIGLNKRGRSMLLKIKKREFGSAVGEATRH